MKLESASYLRSAQITLGNAEAILGIGITDVAAREAYLAAFRAAEALIFEMTGKVAKTHRGVRAEFNRLTRGQTAFAHVTAFLSRGYQLKSDADYGTADVAPPTPAEAAAAIADARAFVASVSAALGTDGS